jgi:opacity protein-like surface antigen
MKKSTYLGFLIVCLLVCGILTNVSAQETKATAKQTTFGIRSAGINIGWYNPSLDYWNDTYFKDNNWENSFDGSMYYGAYLHVNIIKELGVRAGLSYWKETVKSGDIVISGILATEELQLSLTSIPIDVIYQPGFVKFERFMPYAGIGGSFIFIQNKFSRTLSNLPSEETKEQGQDFAGQIILGIERPVIEHLSLGIEFNYVFGKYQQEVKQLTGEIIKKDVSVSGPKIGIKIAYDF